MKIIEKETASTQLFTPAFRKVDHFFLRGVTFSWADEGEWMTCGL
jgi:hypothetical protein